MTTVEGTQKKHLQVIEAWAQKQRKIGGVPVIRALTYDMIQLVNRRHLAELAREARKEEAQAEEETPPEPEEGQEEAKGVFLVSSWAPFIPIIKALIREGYMPITLRPEWAKSLANVDIPARAVAEFVRPEDRRVGFMEAHRLLKSMRAPQRDGLSMGASKFFTEELSAFMFPRIADLSVFSLVLNELDADLVLLHNDVEPLTRAAALWARASKKPCLHVPHAIYFDVEKGGIGADVHDLITASHLAAAGEYQRQWYKDRKFPEANIKLTGLPQFDEWAIMASDRKRARRLLSLDPHRPVIVYASSWGQKTNLLGCHDGVELTYINFLEAVKQIPDVQPVVKVHPRGNNLEFHMQEAKKRGVYCTVTAAYLPQVLQAADAVLTFGPSTLLLEAAHLQSVRLMATHGMENEGVVFDTGVDVDGMLNGMRKVLQEPIQDAAEFLFRYAGVPDGKAGERVTNFALELLSES